MSTGYTDGRLDHLLDSASDPQPPPDFEECVVRRLHRLLEVEEARAEDAALNRLLLQATRPVLPDGFEQRVMERLDLDKARVPRFLSRRWPQKPAQRPYRRLCWARAACLLFATALACLLIGRPEHAGTPSQASVARPLTPSAAETMELSRDSLLTEAFASLADDEVVAALCAVSTDSSEGKTALQRRDNALSASR